jgi:hypothetical protein
MVYTVQAQDRLRDLRVHLGDRDRATVADNTGESKTFVSGKTHGFSIILNDLSKRHQKVGTLRRINAGSSNRCHASFKKTGNLK